jgi:hypothetical protein
MRRVGLCLTALRILAKSKGPHRSIWIERPIDEYLRNDPFSLAHALERLRRARTLARSEVISILQSGPKIRGNEQDFSDRTMPPGGDRTSGGKALSYKA